MRAWIIKKILYLIIICISISFIVNISIYSTKAVTLQREFIPSDFLIQYFKWLYNAIRLDLGYSTKDNRSVLEKIIERLPATIILNAITLIFSFIIAVPLSFLYVFSKRNVRDILDLLNSILFSIPNFWIGLILAVIFGLYLGYLTQSLFGVTIRLPISGMRSLEIALNPTKFTLLERIYDYTLHLILPVISGALFNIALIYNFFSKELNRIMSERFIIALRARGLPLKHIILKHAGKNAIFPLLTLLSLLIPVILSANFIIETIFAWPGIGRLGYDAIMSMDIPMVSGLSLLSAMIVVITHAILEGLYLFFNPNIKVDK